jgi:hypothetical protein
MGQLKVTEGAEKNPGPFGMNSPIQYVTIRKGPGCLWSLEAVV